MKKRILPGLCLCCLFALFLSGCKTPPKDEAQPAKPAQTKTAQQGQTDSLKKANEDLIRQIEEARVKAVEAGAEKYFPDELKSVDTASGKARSSYDNGGKPEDFNKTATDILYQYKALEQAALAYGAREKINELGFARYAQDEYNAAEDAAAKAENMFKNGAAGKDWFMQTKAASDGYRSVLNAGYKILAEQKRKEILELKAKADAIKSAVADKEGYANAIAFYTRGDQDLKSGDAESGYNNFVACYDALSDGYARVSKKRAEAEEAIARAKRRVEESEAIAEKADNLVPIEKVEALDSEDAKLRGAE